MTNVLRGLALVAKEQSTDDETCRFHAPLVRTKSRRLQPFHRYRHRAATCNVNVTIAVQPLVTRTLQSPIGDLCQRSAELLNFLSKHSVKELFLKLEIPRYSTEQALNMDTDISHCYNTKQAIHGYGHKSPLQYGASDDHGHQSLLQYGASDEHGHQSPLQYGASDEHG